ncbi:MAG: hypothetical protein JJV98_19375, partial [Desulfosarcina sp.]|nr:hypothetical protein [Desulfobacterales bacterium]
CCTSLVPAKISAEFIGQYNRMDKFAAILGPAMMGVVGLVARRALLDPGASQLQREAATHLATRFSMASVVLLFVIGGGLLYFTDWTRPDSNRAARGKPL